jgi:hypothetical protein
MLAVKTNRLAPNFIFGPHHLLYRTEHTLMRQADMPMLFVTCPIPVSRAI